MAKLVSLYNHPTDPAAFDEYLRSTHIPIAKKIPGLRSLEISTGGVFTPQGPAPYHLVGVLSFDSMAELQSALGSPEGQAAAADVPNFATGGATILVFDSEQV